jgi:hypothetical protein
MKLNKLTHSILAIAILLTSQFACQALSPTPSATPPPQPTPTEILPVNTEAPATEAVPAESFTDISQFSDEEIMAGIQEALDAYADAYSSNDPDLLDQFVDQENKPFRRIVKSRFDDFQKSASAGQYTIEYNLLDIQRRDFGFVVAHFSTSGGWEANWTFRYLGDRWVLSEPTVEQVGEPVITETEHFTFTTYPWAEDVNPQIMSMLDTARAEVEAVLGKVPQEKANVIILPIYGLRPANSSLSIASYISQQGTVANVIQINTPYSYAYSFYDPALGWDGDLQTTLTHEYTHMTHLLSFDKAGGLSDWMSEGLAEFVSGATENKYWACDAYKSGTFIPIIDESDAVYKQDLMHMYLLEQDFGLSYDFATSLVDFIVEKHGGLDGFWKLANALDETSDFKKAVPQAFGISYEQFDREWQDWLKNQC